MISKRIAFSLLVLLAMSFYSFSALAIDKVIGYCPDEISDNVKPVGNPNQQVYLSAAVRFPASTMSALKGNKISRIRIGIGSGMKNVYVWVRVGSLSTTPVVLQKVTSPAEGWNDVTLDTPYEIDGSEIYVGYSGRQPSDNLCVWLDGEDNENATFINDGTWNDYYGKGWGSLLIQAVVSGDNFANSDMAVEGLSLDSTYYRRGAVAKAGFTVANQGKTAFSGFGYALLIDGKAVATGNVDEALPSSARKTISTDIPLSAVAEGVHQFKVEITPKGDTPDEAAANDTLSRQLLVYEHPYKHNILLEQYTTIPCPNCPYGDRVLEASTNGRDDVVWVAHHVGFQEDELTIKPSRSYMVFGVTGAPMATFDRQFIQVESKQTLPAISIGYSVTSQGAELVSNIYDFIQETPSFVELSTSSVYDPATRNLKVKVNGTRNSIFNPLYPDTRLSIFLIENNVIAQKIQSGTVDDTIHQHVLRDVLTETFGDEVTWKGDSFEAEKSVTLSDAWKAGDMKVVAFLSKPYHQNGPNDAWVFNAAQSAVSDPTGIRNLSLTHPKAGISGGRLYVEGGYDELHVYRADGSEADATRLTRGLYIVKVSKGGVTTTQKITY